MRTSDKGIELIKSFEGLEQTAYPDPALATETEGLLADHGLDVYI